MNTNMHTTGVQNATPATEPNTIGARIRALRKAKGLTQEDLVAELDKCQIFVGPSDISKYERDESNFRVDTLMCLCDILNASSDYILFGNNRPAPVMPDALADSILALADEIRACREGK